MSRTFAIVAATAATLGAGSDNGWSQSRALLEIRTLSSRAEFVSGGDALIEVRAPAGTPIAQLTLALNGKDVTGALKNDPATGSYRGVVEGMTIGTNTLLATAKSPKARHEAKLTIINYPITGPLLSGPHLKPYECSTEQSGLAAALDANCSAPRKIWYLYRSTDNTFKPLADPTGARPADLATTTTSDGKAVPYIVRVDSGTINRAIYQIAMLDDPSATGIDSAAWQPGDGWNRKFVVSFGGSSGTQYIQGVMAPPTGAGGGVVNHAALSKGFGYPTSTARSWQSGPRATRWRCGPHTKAACRRPTTRPLPTCRS